MFVALNSLLGPVVMVTVSSVITFRHARYRAPAEGVLCILAAVGVDAVLRAVAACKQARP